MKFKINASVALISGLLVLIPFVISIPLLVYHFLIFPNFDGFIQDISIYNYDSESQHFLYWSGFWFITLVSLLVSIITASKE